jgi:hypothetical protein
MSGEAHNSNAVTLSRPLLERIFIVMLLLIVTPLAVLMIRRDATAATVRKIGASIPKLGLKAATHSP